MKSKSTSGIIKYYLYTAFTQLRFTRIINVLFIVQCLHENLVKFALFQSVFLFSQFIFEIPSGILGDLMKKKTIIGIGLSILIVSPLLLYSSIFLPIDYVDSALLVAFSLEGIGNALLSGADDALFYQTIREEGSEKRYARIRGNAQLISAIFLGLATFIGGYIFSIHIFLPFIAQSSLLLLAMGVIFSVKSEKVSNDSNVKNTRTVLLEIISVFGLMIKSKNVCYLFLFTTLVVSGINALFSILPQSVAELGFSSSENGTIFMIYSLIGGVVATQSYRLENFSIKRIVGMIITILIFASLLQISGTSVMVIVGLGLLYITVDIIDPIVMSMLNSWVDDKSRATFISGLSFLISLVTMVMTPVMAIILKQYDLITTSIVTAATIILLSIIGYMLLARKSTTV